MRFWAIFLVLAWAPVAWASPLVGLWLGPVDPDCNQSTIEIYPCEAKFCGRVSAVTMESSAFLVDQVILLDLEQKTEASYTGGLIRFDHIPWQFGGSIEMQGQDAATLRGCWARIICQNVPFTRTAG